MGYVDVRDVAAAMVAGIKVKGNHRLLLTGPWTDHVEIINYIASTRPELAPRLIRAVSSGQHRPVLDSSKALEVLGLPSLTPWQKTIDDGLDTILKLEKDWIEKGIDLDNVGLKKNGWLEFQRAGGLVRVKFTDQDTTQAHSRRTPQRSRL